MSAKPFAFINNFSTALPNAVNPTDTAVMLTAGAAAQLNAIIATNELQMWLTLHNSTKTNIKVIQVEAIASNSLALPSGQTVGASFAAGDFCSAFIPAEALHVLRQRQTRNIGMLSSGVGFTVYAENLARAGINTGAHPITIDFQTGHFDGSAQARLVLTENGATPIGTFSWIGAGGKTIRWEGGIAPSFNAAFQDLIVDLEHSPYNDVILGSFQRFG